MLNLSPTFALLDGLGGLEMLVIFVLSLMLFGGKRLPELAKGLGKSIREFKRAASGVEDEIRRAMDMESTPHRRPPVRRPRPAAAPDNPGETPAPEPLPAAKIVEAAETGEASDVAPSTAEKPAPKKPDSTES